MNVPLADGHADLVRHVVVPGGSKGSLTTREAELLEYLAKRPNEDVSRDELLERVWHYKATLQTRAVDVAMRRLREKVEPDPARPTLLVTVTNVGYRFVPPNAVARVEAASDPLPVEATSFVGRAGDLGALDAAFAADAPVVTLVGPPGVGKTRTALHWARAHAGEFSATLWCELAGARTLDAALVVLADALGIPAPAEDDGVDRLAHASAARGACLVVLDNLEQLPQASAWVARWQRHRGPVRLLATSQVRLGVPGERLVELGPLPHDEARALLFDRARASRAADLPSDEQKALDGVTDRLDGLPLAIELAAGRLSALSLPQLYDRLADRMRLLGGASEDRHGTLGAALQWSWDLLDPAARSLLAALSVFRGGFDLEAVEEVASIPDALDALQRLRERSLVTRSNDPRLPGDPRFDLLESVRAFAAHRLREGNEGDVVARHARWFAAEGTRLVDGLWTPRRLVSLARLRRDRANLDAACERGAPEDACAAALALDVLLAIDGPVAQRRSVLDRAVTRAPSDRLRARLLLRRADERIEMRKAAEARADVDAALALIDPSDAELVAEALLTRADALSWHPDMDVDLRRAIELVAADHWLAAESWSLLAGSLGAQGRLEEAEQAGQVARRIHRARGDALGEALALGRLGLVAWDAGHAQPAREHLAAGLDRLRQAESPDNLYRFLGRYVGTVANLHLDGEWWLAVQTEKRDLAARMGNPLELAVSTLQVGQALGFLGRYDEAVAHVEQAIALLPPGVDAFHHGAHQLVLAEILLAADRLPHADRALRAALADLGPEGPLAQTLDLDLGSLLLRLDRVDDALVALERARMGRMPELAAVATAFTAAAHARRGEPADALFEQALAHPVVERLAPWFRPLVVPAAPDPGEPTVDVLRGRRTIGRTSWNRGAMSGDDILRHALVAWRLQQS